MGRSILALGAVSAIALIAAGCKPASTTATASGDPGAASAAAAAMPDANPAATAPTPANEATAPDFVTKAATSDMFEVASSKIALKRSKNADVKAFAQMMIDAHTKTTAALKAAIKASGQAIEPPTVLTGHPQDEVTDLLNADIKDFDKKYMDDQVDGHKAALDLMARYAKDGDVAQIKAFAEKTGPVVQQHYDHAKTIRDALK
jgi:putative membrane protein